MYITTPFIYLKCSPYYRINGAEEAAKYYSCTDNILINQFAFNSLPAIVELPNNN